MLPILTNGMGRDESSVCLQLTMEEIEELLSRCLNSEEGDTPVFQQALLKLARASFQSMKPSDLLGEKKTAGHQPETGFDDLREAA